MTLWSDLAPPYATIVADPPWHYDAINPPNPGLTPNRPAFRYAGRKLPYDSLSLDAIRALPVADLAAPDARIFLWATNRYLRHAWSVIEAWDFEPLDRVFVWCKQPMGTANVTTEFLLTGKRGRPPKLPWHNSTWFAWPRQGHRHSQKPPAALDLIETWSPGPYVELFARAQRLGWDTWGFGHAA
jgi:N6-adenosine-specific RNA methylase IME4